MTGALRQFKIIIDSVCLLPFCYSWLFSWFFSVPFLSVVLRFLSILCASVIAFFFLLFRIFIYFTERVSEGGVRGRENLEPTSC